MVPVDSASHGMCLNGGGGVKFQFCLGTTNNVFSMEYIENSFVMLIGKVYHLKLHIHLCFKTMSSGTSANPRSPLRRDNLFTFMFFTFHVESTSYSNLNLLVGKHHVVGKDQKIISTQIYLIMIHYF